MLIRILAPILGYDDAAFSRAETRLMKAGCWTGTQLKSLCVCNQVKFLFGTHDDGARFW